MRSTSNWRRKSERKCMDCEIQNIQEPFCCSSTSRIFCAQQSCSFMKDIKGVADTDIYFHKAWLTLASISTFLSSR
jgi:hypothetical protein